MQCYTPMIRVYQEADRETREFYKNKGLTLEQHVIPREEVQKRLHANENYFTGIKRLNKENAEKGILWRYQLIPCRHCFACSLNYSAEWGTRIMCECKQYEHNYFVTLTYSEKYLPIEEKLSLGEWEFENDGTWTGTLVPDHVQDFIKRLRRYLQYNKNHTDMKYYLCGEYGEENGRPHYHLILINCPLDTKQFYKFKVDENYKPHWRSKELERLWSVRKDGKRITRNTKPEEIEQIGIVDVAEVEWNSAAYVARYCAKKWNKQADPLEYISMGKRPEFVRMSDNIGLDYYNEHKHEIYKTDAMITKTMKGVATVKPPKAWDKRLEKELPELFDKIKEHRKYCMERSEEVLRTRTDMTDKQMLEMSAEKTITKSKLLPRTGEF